MSDPLPIPTGTVSQADLTIKAVIQTNPVRFARAAMSQPLQDTLGRISGAPGGAGPG